MCLALERKGRMKWGLSWERWKGEGKGKQGEELKRVRPRGNDAIFIDD
jgi:hypothetical protein